MERINISVNLWLKMLKLNLAVKRVILLHRQFAKMPVLQLQRWIKRKTEKINLSFFSASHRHAPPKFN
ncbi:MAG: hypothetical protein ACLQQ4_16840 [Bacteroidia bacterium]